MYLDGGNFVEPLDARTPLLRNIFKWPRLKKEAQTSTSYFVKDDVSETESYKSSFQGKEKLKLVKMSLTNTILLTSFLLLITSNSMITIGHPMAFGKSHPILNKLIENQQPFNKNDDL